MDANKISMTALAVIGLFGGVSDSKAQVSNKIVNYEFTCSGANYKNYPIYGEFRFNSSDYILVNKAGGSGGGRGINTVHFDGLTKKVYSVKNFDTWGNPVSFRDLTNCVNSIKNGDYVFFGICDDGGFNEWDNCNFYQSELVQGAVKMFENFGSKRLKELCYRDSWAMFIKKGDKEPIYEDVTKNSFLRYTFQTSVPVTTPTLKISQIPTTNTSSSSQTILEIEGPIIRYNFLLSKDLMDWKLLEPYSPYPRHYWGLNQDTGNVKMLDYDVGEGSSYPDSKFYRVDIRNR